MSGKQALPDSEIAKRMLKLFDGGASWARGLSYRESCDGQPEQWCLIGAYRQAVHGTQQVSVLELDATEFVQNLALLLARKYSMDGTRYSATDIFGVTTLITSVNDYKVSSYEEIRQILEEMIGSEQAERDGERNGTAAD